MTNLNESDCAPQFHAIVLCALKQIREVSISTQFLVFPISTRVDITVYQHGKCFIFLKC